MSASPIEQPSVLIRSATPDDLVGILQLLGETDRRSPERESAVISLDVSGRIVAELDGEVVGHVYAGDKRGIPVISGLTTAENVRGQRIATALLRAVEQDLRRQGRHTAELEIDDGTPDWVIKWYEAQGYKPQYRYTGHVKPLGEIAIYGGDEPLVAFDRVDNNCRPHYVGVHTAADLQLVSDAMQHTEHADVVWAGAKVQQGDESDGLYLTPWFESQSEGQMLVRWARVPMSHALPHVLQEIRRPARSRPPANPMGEHISPGGVYLLYREDTLDLTAFRITPGQPAASLLSAEESAPHLQDLQYAGRVV